MTTSATPFLMFEGDAEAAMNHYVSVFGGEILHITRHPEALPAQLQEAIDAARAAGTASPVNDVAGQIAFASFSIAGQTVYCSDSIAKHAFSFTPSVSLFIEVDDPDEVDRLAAELGTGEQVFMPVSSDYGFSPRFAWVGDRWGVTWQIAARPVSYAG